MTVTQYPASGGRVTIGIVHRTLVHSHSTPGLKYWVTLDAAGNWHCQCGDHTFRGTECKHIAHERLHYALWRRTPLASLL